MFEIRTVFCAWILFWTHFFSVVKMDGFFSGYTSPRRKPLNGSVLSPFCTSPSQLQEVTLGANGTLAADQTKISPMRGRSVKEYDEQLTALKKENFNLKLRIYFLEERMGHTFRLEDKDNVLRKNIEYQVEIESLRKELEDKQDLLCQAVKAMQLEEEEHKKILQKKDLEFTEMSERMLSLQKETNSLLEVNEILIDKQDKLMEDSTAMYTEAFNLHDENSKTKEEIEQLQHKIEDLEAQLVEEHEHSAALENNLHESECMQIRCNNLEAELEQRDNKLKSLVTELEQTGHSLSSCNLRIRTLDDEINSKKGDIEFKEQELNQRDKIIRDQSVEIEELKKIIENGHVMFDKEQRQSENLKSAVLSRDNNIADLESKLEKCKSVIRNLEAKLDSIAHQNKRHQDELQTMKMQRRTKSVNDNENTLVRTRLMDWSPRKSGSPRSMSSASSSSSNHNDNGEHPLSLHRPDHELLINTEMVAALREELKKKDFKLCKLDEEQRKACNLIQSFMLRTKNLEKEILEMKVNVERKDIQLEDMQRTMVKRAAHVSPVPLQNSLVIGKSSVSRQSDKENSTEESDERMSSEELKRYKTMTLEWEKEIQDLIQTLKAKEEQLEMYEKEHEATTSTLKNKDNRITELEKEVDELNQELSSLNKKLEELKSEKQGDTARPWTRVTEEKDKKIERLESEVRKHTFNLQGIVNTELWEKNREIEKLQNRFTDKMKIKDQEISKLEKDITAKDMQLKILKDKIGELGIHVNLPCGLLSTKLQEHGDAIEIPEEITALQEQLKITTEKSKYLEKTLEDLRQQMRNTPERDTDSKLLQLKSECSRLQQEYDKSEKYRLELANVCVLLTTRLEELAHFLDSLLKHKSVLGLLGIKQQSVIKHAIDQSLDLSKTFSISMMNEETSLEQLSSISGLLNASHNSVNMSMFESYIEEDPEKHGSVTAPVTNVSLTYNSHLSKQKGEANQNKDIINEQNEIINVLRGQIETMKKEIEIRDMELANQNVVTSEDMQEQSLKNDNELVEVIMGLQKKSPLNKKCLEVMSPGKIYQNLMDGRTCSPLINHVIDNQSESEAWSEPDRDVSQARIGLDSETLKSSSMTNLMRSRSNRSGTDGVSTESTEDEMSNKQGKSPSKRGSGSLDTRHTIHALQENVGALENKLKEKDNELLTLQCKMMEMDNKLKENQIKMFAELENLRKEKLEVETLLKESEKMITVLENIREENEVKLEGMAKERSNALINIEEKQIQIEKLKEIKRGLEKIVDENEINLQSSIKENDNKWISKLKKAENEAELRLSEVQKATEELKKQYETEWVKKNEMNQYNEKIIYNELESLKEVLKLAENKEKSLEQSEIDMKRKLQESEKTSREKILCLKRETIQCALRTAQAVLERTKVNNEKLKLEQELRKLELSENERSQEFSEKEKQSMNIRKNLQKQLSQIEAQKSSLQLKVSELETTNAELQNRVLRLQSNNPNNAWPKSTPTSPIKISEVLTNVRNIGKHSLGNRICFTRQRSDMSGYASEDVLTDENDGVAFNRSAPEGYHWFNHSGLNIPLEVADARNIANSSPDLGIESDPGRFSSLETNVTSRPLLQTLELTASMNNLLADNHVENSGHYCNVLAHKSLEKKNVELQKTVSRLENGLERTMNQLSLINQKKKQVEKAVCKEINKTSIVLRHVRANVDSGSENDVLRK